MREDYIDFASRYYEDLYHPLCVADSFEELSDCWIVGLLHDILEDTDVEERNLLLFLNLKGKSYLFEEIKHLTRLDGMHYFVYIESLSGLARLVKISDIRHNLSRVETLSDSLKLRYTKALSILSD